jgi:tetratricopeptide (TPR) repeat protein
LQIPGIHVIRNLAPALRRCLWLFPLWLAIATGCGSGSRLESHLQRGRDYLARGDLAHASIEFRNAIQVAPKDVDARLLEAQTLEKLGQMRDAAGVYQSVLELQPDNLQAQASLGRIEVFAGFAEPALKTIAPGLEKHPDSAALLSVRAMARAQLKDLEGATADASRALQLDPGSEDAISLRAGLYERAGDFSKGEALISEALKRLPKSTALREVLLSLYLHDNAYDAAEGQLRVLIDMRPAEMRYRKQLAVVYARTQRLDDAQKVLEDGIKAAPASAEAKLTLIAFLANQRSPADAEKALAAFIAQQPDNYDLRFGLADLQMQAKDSAGALATYREIQTRAGKDPSGLLARDRIAGLELAANHDAQAQQLVDEVLRQNPRDAEALLIRGKLSMRRSEPGAAIEDLRAVVRDQPTSIPLQQLLASAYLANGDPVLAEQTLRAALELDPANIAARVQLADLLLKTNRVDAAVTMLEEAVRRDATDPLAREALINGYLATHDYKSALRASEDLKTLRPKEAVGYYLAGVAARGQNDLDLAQAQFERAHESAPRALEPLAALTQLYLARGQKAKALALAQQAVTETKSQDAVTLNLLGEVYMAANDMSHAVDALTLATQLSPTWWPPYRNLALAKGNAGDRAAAIAAYQAALKVAPNEAQLTTELALLYEKGGELDKAIALYDAGLKRDPKSEALANNLAMLLVTYKSDQRSLDRARDLTAALAGSSSASFLDTAGWVRVKRGEYDAALPVLERASSLSPASREIRYHLGVAQVHAGQQARARENLESALTGASAARWTEDARAVLAELKSRTG